MVSRWGNDKEYRVESAKAFAILLHLMKGTPYIYQGEEIGMTNYPVASIEEVEDIESVNMYHERIANGYSKEEIIKSINTKGRDNARTPMQWDTTENAGFTTGTPWLHVNPNYQNINVEAALQDQQSIFYTYQTLIRLRKENPLVVWGEYELLETTDYVFSYIRSFEKEQWLVVVNLSDEAQPFTSDKTIKEIMIENMETPKDIKQITLNPWQAFVAKI